jgi:hypothetical protein
MRRLGREVHWLLLGWAGWMTLLALSACATSAAGQRPSATPPPSATATSAAATTPTTATPPAAAAPDSPTPVSGSAEAAPPSATTPPPAEAVPMSGPSPASSGADKMLPPCAPVHRARPKHPKPKEARPPQNPSLTGPPPPAPVDAVVDAQVGEVGTSLGSILGRDVTSPKGEDLGRVVDVLADAQGHVRVAIIDFGGFLGVGTRRIAVDWPLLRFDLSTRDKPLILSVDRQKLQSAPEYNSNKPRVLVPPAAPDDAPDTGQTKK